MISRTVLSSLKNRFSPRNAILRAKTSNWDEHSRLIVRSDNSNWALDWDGRELLTLCKKLGIKTVRPEYSVLSRHQSVFYTSKYDILMEWKPPKHRIAFPYFHGKPSSGDGFARMISAIETHHDEIARIQVSHSEMHEIILETGINSHKVFKIPIGINPDYFVWTTPEEKQVARMKLGIPQSSVVIGTFQKDGNGWGEGLKPKLIKGPDVFLKTIKILKPQVPEIFVLLTGPARGYVKNGLEKLGVPYLHKYLNDYTQIGEYFNALDLYIVSSREEGGPKAVLESMASGIPLVTSKVGQAMDLVRHCENAWIVEPEDAEELAHWAGYVIDNPSSLREVLGRGRLTAEGNSYPSQIPLWREFMSGFVECA